MVILNLHLTLYNIYIFNPDLLFILIIKYALFLFYFVQNSAKMGNTSVVKLFTFTNINIAYITSLSE